MYILHLQWLIPDGKNLTRKLLSNFRNEDIFSIKFKNIKNHNG